MPISALVSCGSNIDPVLNLRTALDHVAACLEVKAASQVFVTRAVGESIMPDFHNVAFEVLTELSAAELKFGVLRRIEWELGRRRSANRNAPRSIDLDLSLFGDQIFEAEAGLEIPDPEILTRTHVALPLADIAPDRVHPISGETLDTIASRLRAAAGHEEICLAEPLGSSA